MAFPSDSDFLTAFKCAAAAGVLRIGSFHLPLALSTLISLQYDKSRVVRWRAFCKERVAWFFHLVTNSATL